MKSLPQCFIDLEEATKKSDEIVEANFEREGPWVGCPQDLIDKIDALHEECEKTDKKLYKKFMREREQESH